MRKHLFISILCIGLGGHFLASADTTNQGRFSPLHIASKEHAPGAALTKNLQEGAKTSGKKTTPPPVLPDGRKLEIPTQKNTQTQAPLSVCCNQTEFSGCVPTTQPVTEIHQSDIPMWITCPGTYVVMEDLFYD